LKSGERVHVAAELGLRRHNSETSVDPQKKYPILSSLVRPFSGKHRGTLALVISAIAVAGEARSFAVAQRMASWGGRRMKGQLNRFYRLMANLRIDDTLLARQMADLLCEKPTRRLLVSIDWTEWHHQRRLLAASITVGKRAVPLFVQAFFQRVWRRSQNTRENHFLRALAAELREVAVKAIVLCDRGFRRVSWIVLLQQLQLGFVIRLQSDVLVEIEPGTRVALSDILLTQGVLVDLGLVPVRSDGAVVVRVIGYWAPGAHEPWWLATSETTDARHVLKLYDRRMTVEEHFRDSKGCRFGARLFWTQFQNPVALGRFFMLLGAAMLLWSLTGRAAAKRDPTLRMVSRSKGPRQSYLTIGLRILRAGESAVYLAAFALRRFLEPPALRRVAGASVGGK
jgi:Transposase DDE domain